MRKRRHNHPGQGELFSDKPRVLRRARLPHAPTEAAIEQVTDNARQMWLEFGYLTGERIARLSSKLTSADIDLEMMKQHPEIKTHEKRAMGGVIRRLQSGKIIEATPDFLPDPRDHCHSNPIRVWRSLIYAGAA